MITRMLTLILIAVLPLPVSTLTRPAETGPSPRDEAALPLWQRLMTLDALVWGDSS
jgi:hypothetical protein